MDNSKELQRVLGELLAALPEEARAGISIQYGFQTPINGPVDVVIHRNDEFMALGRFRTVNQQAGSGFSARFQLAMGYPDDCWYLFDFDGERMVLNDLSYDHPVDEYPESAVVGISRLLMRPEEWKSKEKKFQDMKLFIDLICK